MAAGGSSNDSMHLETGIFFQQHLRTRSTSLRTPSWSAPFAAADLEALYGSDTAATRERLVESFGSDLYENLTATWTMASGKGSAARTDSGDEGSRHALATISILFAQHRHGSNADNVPGAAPPMGTQVNANVAPAEYDVSGLFEGIHAVSTGTLTEAQLASRLDQMYGVFGQENVRSISHHLNVLADEPPLALASMPELVNMFMYEPSPGLPNLRRRGRSNDFTPPPLNGANPTAGAGAGAALPSTAHAAGRVPDISDTPLSDDAVSWGRFDWAFATSADAAPPVPPPVPPPAANAPLSPELHKATATAVAGGDSGPESSWIPASLQAPGGVGAGGDRSLPPRIHPDWVLHDTARLQKILAIRAMYLEQAESLRRQFVSDMQLRSRLTVVPATTGLVRAQLRQRLGSEADRQYRERLGVLHDALLDTLEKIVHAAPPRLPSTAAYRHGLAGTAANRFALAAPARPPQAYNPPTSPRLASLAAADGMIGVFATPPPVASTLGYYPAEASSLSAARQAGSSGSSGSTSSGSGGSGHRRFDRTTVLALERYFRQDPYPDDATRRYIASTLQLTHKQVINWFTNKRMRTQPRS